MLLLSIPYGTIHVYGTIIFCAYRIRQVPSLHTTASGFIVTSQNRILDHEAVITNITEIAGDQAIGKIQCRSYNGGDATWVRPGSGLSTSHGDVYSKNGPTATLFVKRTSKTGDDFYCSNSTYGGRHYINLYLSNSKSMITNTGLQVK